MNDFTKDELETLILWIADIPDIKDWPEDCNRTRYYRKLASKIQSMIDNYCEPCEHSPAPNQSTNARTKCWHCGEEY